MDVCADPSSLHAPYADPAEVAEFYGNALRALTTYTVQLAEKVAAAPELHRLDRVAAIERLSGAIRRNALVHRHLIEPIRVPRHRTETTPAREKTLAELTDEELEVAYTEALDREGLDRATVDRETRERRDRERLDQYERLERERVERLEKLPNRPIPEIIDQSCRDLGFSDLADFQHRTDAEPPPATAQAPESPPPARDHHAPIPGNPPTTPDPDTS